ncbi:MAG TPA: HNH endonuclease [Chthoniobacteraceae bacterium]|jgi:putative restriction endonuclease|nr:HNH endonuclease [Chthoniobacteraceae bacterium]
MTSKQPNVRWTREHALIALNLYCKLPFGKLHKGNPIIIETAKRLGRTANSLAMKLCNFASLDPIQRARGIGGLPNVSQQDRQLWADFLEDSTTLGEESEELIHNLFTKEASKELDFLDRDNVRTEIRPYPNGVPTEGTATVKIRRGQQFFRQSILNAYDLRCCISGIGVPSLLVASHIMPWRDFPNERLNPSNGLCLSSLHDAAFDSGLITLNDGLCLVLSKRLRSYLPQAALDYNFESFEGTPIRLPEKLAKPDPKFLDYHRRIIFQK